MSDAESLALFVVHKIIVSQLPGTGFAYVMNFRIYGISEDMSCSNRPS